MVLGYFGRTSDLEQPPRQFDFLALAQRMATEEPGAQNFTQYSTCIYTWRDDHNNIFQLISVGRTRTFNSFNAHELLGIVSACLFHKMSQL